MARRDPEARSRSIVVVIGLILLSLVALNLPQRPQRSIAHWVRQTALWPFLEVNGAVVRFRARALDFDVLRAQMDSALALVSGTRTLAEENRQLRGMLDLREREPGRYVVASVGRIGTSGSQSVVRLDAGSSVGVRPFNAVVTEGGLLGQVQEVYGDYALAYDWSHPDFRASVMTRDGEYHGLIEAVRGEYREQDRLVLRGTDFLSEIAPQTEVLTSGRGGTFPRGIRVGWVEGVADVSAGWSKSYYVTPAVVPSSATYAAIGVDPAPGPTEISPSGGLATSRPRQGR